MALPPPGKSQNVLITGASSGIGEQMAREFARLGYGVILVARSADTLKAMAAELTSAGVQAEAMPCDLSDPADRDRLAAEIQGRGAPLAALVNNAGFATVGRVSESTVEAELGMVEVNVNAVVHLCTAFLPAMVDAGAGGILNVASTAAYQPIPGQSGYGATKSFVLSYSQALRGEVDPGGINVTALCPGPVKTGFGERAGFSDEDAEATLPSFMWEPAEQVAKAGVNGLRQNRPVVIPGTPNRVVAMLSYLAPKRLVVPLVASRHPGLR